MDDMNYYRYINIAFDTRIDILWKVKISNEADLVLFVSTLDFYKQH